MLYTENYQFRKPIIGVDIADVKDLNFNSDKLDALLYNTQISLAPAYDLLETYNTGDIVMYETLMYKCKTDNVTGAWDASKWERTTAGEEGSGGGGTDVEANPTGTPTDTLDTIRIGQTIYDIAGSGATGGGLERTLLYTTGSYTTGCPYQQDVTLLDNLSKYDFISVETGTITDNSSGGAKIDVAWYDVSEILQNDVSAHWAGYSIRWWQAKFTDTTFNMTARGSESGSYLHEIFKIFGYKISSGSGSGTTSEIIPITAGNDTTSRTFTFDKTPKFIKFYWGDPVITGGWALDGEIVWGQSYMNFRAKQMGASVGYVDGGIDPITYGADGKSITITGGNAFGALNTSNGSGYMFVDYGDGSGSSEEISDMTWTELISTTGTSTAVAIPQGTKKLVLTAQLGGIVTKVAEESIANIQKLLDVSLETTWNMGGEYADTAGNHTTIAMSVSNGQVVAKSGYSTVTAKVYALS